MEYMKTKICFKCGSVKELDRFYKHSRMNDGHLNKCKECTKDDTRQNYAKRIEQYRAYDRDRQRRSRTRIFNHRYKGILQRVNGTATRKYSVEGKEALSYKDYCVWIKNNIDDFERLYKEWQESEYSRKLTPSIDRIDNTKGYTGDNMRWITHSDNSKKSTKVIPF